MLHITLTIFYILVFLFLIRRFAFFKNQYIPSFFPTIAFLLKIVAGIILTYIYTYYYTNRNTADIYKYFDDSLVMYNAAFTNFPDFLKMLTGIGNDSSYFNEMYYDNMNWWYRQSAGNIYNDSHIIIRFNTLVRFFSFGNFYVHTVFMCFLSFSGSIALYKAFTFYIKNKEKQLFAGIMLLPSILFWSSGVLKEGILLFAIGFLLFSYFNILILKKYTLTYFFILFSTSLLLFYLKFYIFASLLPSLIAFTISRRRVAINYIAVLLLYIAVILVVTNFHPNLSPLKLLTEKQQAFLELAKSEKAGSILYNYNLNSTPISFIKNLPYAIKNTFYLPSLLSSKSFIEILASLENLLLQFSLVAAIFFRKKLSLLERNFLWMCAIFSSLLFLLIGMSTPILGAIVRYKTPALPFFFAIILLLSDHNKLLKKCNFYKLIYDKLENFFHRFTSV